MQSRAAAPRQAMISGCLADFVCQCAAAERVPRQAPQSDTRRLSGRRFLSENNFLNWETFPNNISKKAVWVVALYRIASCHVVTNPTLSKPDGLDCTPLCCILSYCHIVSQWHHNGMSYHIGLHLWFVVMLLCRIVLCPVWSACTVSSCNGLS